MYGLGNALLTGLKTYQGARQDQLDTQAKQQQMAQQALQMALLKEQDAREAKKFEIDQADNVRKREVDDFNFAAGVADALPDGSDVPEALLPRMKNSPFVTAEPRPNPTGWGVMDGPDPRPAQSPSGFRTVQPINSKRELAQAQQKALMERYADQAAAAAQRAEAANQVRLQIAEIGAASKDANAPMSLTPEGIEMAALQLRKNGVMLPMGMGDRTNRQAVINRAATLTPEDMARIEAGGYDIAGAAADYKANVNSLKTLQTQRDAIGAFEQTAQKNIQNFLGVAGQVVDTGIPLLNTPTRWAAGALGSKAQAQYGAVRQEAISEIAKIVQNPNLMGQLSDSARKEVEAFSPSNATLGQTIAVMKILSQGMDNRAKSLDDQIATIRGRMKQPSNATSAGPTRSYTIVPK